VTDDGSQHALPREYTGLCSVRPRPGVITDARVFFRSPTHGT
jgi:hypothetical protein